jgi:transposase
MSTTVVPLTSPRKSKLDAEAVRQLEHGLRTGMTRWQAATHAGIHRSQFYRWLERAKAEREAGKDTIHTKLLHDVEQAEVELMFELLRVMRGGDEVAAKAARWILEKKWPHEFSWRGPKPSDPVPPAVIIREPVRAMDDAGR